MSAAFTSTVAVRPLPEQTDPGAGRHAYAYTVTIRNAGPSPAQVVARRWTIVDAAGRTQEVRGLGVVGQQPMLKPGEVFEYTSWAVIATPHGTMRGAFIGITDDAHWFESPVAEFALVDAAALH